MRAFLIVALVTGLGLGVAWDAYRALHAPLPLSEPVNIELPPGAALGPLLRGWQHAGYLSGLRQREYLDLYARLSGAARAVQAGEYRLTPGLSVLEALALIQSGRVVQHELTLVEGWRFDQALRAVKANSALRHTLKDDSGAAAMAAIGHPGEPPEGRFLPETYRFPRGTTDVAFLRRAFDAMQGELEKEWTARDPDLPYTKPYEALIMAAIIERETAVPDERGRIAGVFVRRLQRGMKLQTDPAVIYGLGNAFDGNLRKRDLAADSPYNTYRRAGLPPTPICLPGRAALHAALHPAPGNSLYFVSKRDGSHYFSATLAEHNAAVRRYQLGRKE